MNSTSPNDDAIHILERLLVACQDGVEGYRRAADDVEDSSVRRFLAHASAEREEVASVLTNELVALGHKPTHHGSIPGAVHRRWLDALAVLERRATPAILRECQRGEHETLSAFTAAMGRSVPEDVRKVIQAQLGRLLHASAALNRIALDVVVPDKASER
jgi:uncharacterized protein (TIGR02284 family)